MGLGECWVLNLWSLYDKLLSQYRVHFLERGDDGEMLSDLQRNPPNNIHCSIDSSFIQ